MYGGQNSHTDKKIRQLRSSWQSLASQQTALQTWTDIEHKQFVNEVEKLFKNKTT